MPVDGSGARIRDALRRLDGNVLTGTPVTAQGSTRDDLRVVEVSESPLQVRLGQPVFAGGHAGVAAAVTEDGDRVAVRVELYQRFAPDAFRRAAMVRAAELARRRPDDYPALLRVRQVFTTVLPEGCGMAGAEVMCDVQEWCDPLGSLLQGNPNGMPGRQAVALILPVLRTMHRLHTMHKWVHRDIDEGNVLVAGDGTLRVADLGIVSMLPTGGNHNYTTLYGKAFAMPPEARVALKQGLAGDAFRIEPSYDVWQLGRLLYMLLTGDDARVPELQHTDPAGRWHRWGGIGDPRLLAVVRGLVDPEPARRTRLGRAAEDLQHWLDRGPNGDAAAAAAAAATTIRPDDGVAGGADAAIGAVATKVWPQGGRAPAARRLSYGSGPGNDVVLPGLAARHLTAERLEHGTWLVSDVSPRRTGFVFGTTTAMWAEVPAGAVLRVGAHRIVLP